MRLPALQGQRRASAVLEALLAAGRLPPALLLHGPAGVGKRLAAREVAKALLCRQPPFTGEASCGDCPDCAAAEAGSHPDLAFADAAYQASLLGEEEAKQKVVKLELVLHLRRLMELRPLLDGWKVAVIPEAQDLNDSSANALLKALEEPLPKTLWILATNARERLPRTVASRCFPVPFGPLPDAVLAGLLAARGLTSGRAHDLARLAEGSAGRALELAEHSPLEGLRDPAFAGESLPKDLTAARAAAERLLFALAQDLRRRALEDPASWPRREPALRELQRLGRALRANADPRLTATLAALAAEPERSPA